MVMILDAQRKLSDKIHIPDKASIGCFGWVISLYEGLLIAIDFRGRPAVSAPIVIRTIAVRL